MKLFPAEGDANEEVYRTVEEGLEEADRRANSTRFFPSITINSDLEIISVLSRSNQCLYSERSLHSFPLALQLVCRPQLMRQWSLSNAPKLVMTDGHWFMLMLSCDGHTFLIVQGRMQCISIAQSLILS